MESVLRHLEQRKETTEDEGFKEIVEEVESNWEIYSKELEEPTLKHGTDTVNFEEIAEEGLIPGKENNAETGESSNYEDVCFSTSYPIALRYSELTEVNNHLRTTDLEEANIGNMESPMVVEIPITSFHTINVDQRNGDTIREVLGADINRYQAALVSEACEEGPDDDYPLSEFIDYDEDGMISDLEDGKEKAQEAAHSLLSDEEVDPEILRQYGFFDHLDHNEMDASFLNEVCTDHATTEDMTIYVPQSELKKYRQKAEEENLDVRIGSLEGRALVHEARMEEEYEESGCINYTRPEDGEFGVNVIESEEEYVPHDSSPEVVHISRLDGEPIYPKA